MEGTLVHGSIFFHEDYYCQIELIPEENYFITKRQFNKSTDQDEFTLGLEECNIRESKPVNIATRKISIKDISSILNPLAKSYSDNIESGYGSTTYRIKNSNVWGFDYYGIFVEYQNGIISNIWLWTNSNFSNNNSGINFHDALLHIGIQYKLILVDWNREIVVRFSNPADLNNYLINNLGFDLIK